jgi:chorismate mutase/prephenate dehydrogenase
MSARTVRLSELDGFTTPVFRAKMEVIQKVFCDNPGLYAEIVSDNPQSEFIIEEYRNILSKLEGLLSKKDGPGLTRLLEEAALQLYPEENR